MGGEERDHGAHVAAHDQPRLVIDRAGRHRAPHLNGVLAAFVAGIVFNFAGSSDAKESQEEIQEAISRFFDLPIFVLLGMAIPWEAWIGLGWSGLLVVAAVLLLRRLPAVLTLRPLLGPLRKGYDVLFLGWFGPVGAAALY